MMRHKIKTQHIVAMLKAGGAVSGKILPGLLNVNDKGYGYVILFMTRKPYQMKPLTPGKILTGFIVMTTGLPFQFIITPPPN